MAVAIMLFVSGCKKYGYKFKDGYESGEDNSNAIGGSGLLGNDFSKINEAAIFPGIVDPGERRIDTTITINMNYKYVTAADLRVVQTPQPWFSTGLYAPAGEPITLDVPAGFDGLTVQIGGWTDNLTGLPVIKRDPIIYNQLQLSAGKNYIRNLYGGSVYIRKNTNVTGQTSVTLGIKGAVKSPDFVLGQTTDAAWAAMMQNSTVPWVQLRGRKIIFELPKFLFEKFPLTNPTALMEEWDRFIDLDVYKWKNLEDATSDSLNKAPELPVRVIMDAQLRSSYAHNSYPVVIQLDENLFTAEIANLTNLREKGAWRTMSEIGKNNITGTWRFSEIPNVNDLYAFKFANRLGATLNLVDMQSSLKLGVDSAMWYIKGNLTDLFPGDFSKEVPGISNNFIIKLVPFLQLFKAYGWGMFGYIENKARHSIRQSMSNQEKINFFYQAASEYAGKDLYMFFYTWNLLPTDVARDEIAARIPAKLDKDIYNYNPVLDTGGTRVARAEPKMINRTAWRVIDYCCQESDANSLYATNTLDGNATSYWHSQYVYSSGQYHLPHYMTFDMNRFYDIGGFWYIGGPTWRPNSVRLYFSKDNIEWFPASGYSGNMANNTNFNSVNFSPTGTVFSQMRYVKLEMVTLYNTRADNACSLAEFGLNKP